MSIALHGLRTELTRTSHLPPALSQVQSEVCCKHKMCIGCWWCVGMCVRGRLRGRGERKGEGNNRDTEKKHQSVEMIKNEMLILITYFFLLFSNMNPKKCILQVWLSSQLSSNTWALSVHSELRTGTHTKSYSLKLGESKTLCLSSHMAKLSASDKMHYICSCILACKYILND